MKNKDPELEWLSLAKGIGVLFFSLTTIIFGGSFIFHILPPSMSWIETPLLIYILASIIIIIIFITGASIGYIKEYETWKEIKERDKRAADEEERRIMERNTTLEEQTLRSW